MPCDVSFAAGSWQGGVQHAVHQHVGRAVGAQVSPGLATPRQARHDVTQGLLLVGRRKALERRAGHVQRGQELRARAIDLRHLLKDRGLD